LSLKGAPGKQRPQIVNQHDLPLDGKQHPQIV
jgi:hypothetical protein